MASGDDVFGPQLRGSFDFTLVFEQTILSIAPSALFIATAIPRFHSLLRRPVEARSGLLLWFKLTCGVVLACIQIAAVVLWSLSSEEYRRFSIAASVLSLLAAIILIPLSYVEHKRAIRPSSLLSGYLFLSVLLDLAQARSLWIRHDLERLAVVFILALITKGTLLLLEEAPKTALLFEKSKDVAPEATSGLINRTVFWWLNVVFKRGYRTLLDMPDLDALEEKLTSDWLLDILTEDKSRKRALLEATMWAFRYQLGAAIIPRLAFGGFVFAQPFLINRVINFVGDEPSEFDQGIIGGLIGATVLIYCGIAATRAIYKHLTYQLLTMIRGGLISLIFQKTLQLDRGVMTDAAPVTMMSTDIDGMTQGFQYIHDIWGFFIEIGVGLFVLQKYVGYSAFLVVVPSFLSLVAIHFVSVGIGPARVAWNRGVQKRVAHTSSMLAQMKGIKMMGLSKFMLGEIQGFRIFEVDLSKKFRWLVVCLNAIANSVDLLSPVFVIIAAVYLTHNDDGLGVAEAFTALSVMVLISLPLAHLLVLYPMIASGIACFGRIQTFLLLEDHKDYRLFLEEYKTDISQIDNGPSTPTDHVEMRTMRSDQNHTASAAGQGTSVVEIENASFKTKDDTEVLHNVSLKIPQCQLTMLIGRVGYGKSSLLKAILGEMYLASGSLVVRSQSIAYCDQTPWLMNKSVKENIVTVLDFNEEWYNQVTQACGLEQDFASLASGDDTVVGSGGMALSGGQKQRVALARAVYARQELLLLDDVFSGLDNSTSNFVFARLLGSNGLLRQNGTTVVLATHAVKFLHHADYITMLDAGNVTYNQVRFDSVDPATWGRLDEESSSEEDVSGAEDIEAPEVTKKDKAIQPAPKDKDDMTRAQGDIGLYVFYVKSVGVPLCLGFLALAGIFILGGKVPQIWLRIWTERGTNTDKEFYVGIYALIAILVCVACTVTVWYFLLLLIPKSAQNLHLLLLEAVLAAPLYFFTTTDLGVTLNRFSQDMTLVDQILPMSLFSTVFDSYSVIAEAALIASGATYVAAIIPFCFAALYFLQKYYLRTSRQVRHLDLEAKSPLYTLFTETLSGLITVRAFGWKGRFLRLNAQLLDESQKPYYLLYAIQRWLNVVLDLFVAGVALVLVAFALNFRGTTGKGAIGLAMVNIINFNTSLSQLINAWTLLETSLGAIARLRTFMADTPKEAQESERQNPPPGWPTSGSIEFQNVTATYSPNTESVLHNISLSIKPGQKIGFCGRTGSGKSSMILTLVRMLEIQEGSLRIDGIDLTVLPRQTIRSLLTTLPQDPVKLAGTIRDNLDPEKKLADNPGELEKVLKKTNIWDVIEARGGLDAEFDSIGFSVGQQQLFCLARAILHRSRVLLLDEATSSVDRQSDEEIRKVITEEFADCTVLEVAHRLDNLVNFDTIVVMEQGRIVETGNPKELLEGSSKFRSLWDSQRG